MIIMKKLEDWLSFCPLLTHISRSGCTQARGCPSGRRSACMCDYVRMPVCVAVWACLYIYNCVCVCAYLLAFRGTVDCSLLSSYLCAREIDCRGRRKALWIVGWGARRNSLLIGWGERPSLCTSNNPRRNKMYRLPYKATHRG